MVIGDKHCKHTDEGPCRTSRRTRSPSVAVPAAALTASNSSTDDGDGEDAGAALLYTATTDYTEANNREQFPPGRIAGLH